MKFNVMDPRDVSIVRSHPATKKRNFLRKVTFRAEHPSIAQAQARLSLSEFATSNLYGKTGTVVLPDGRVISLGAYTVMTMYPHTGAGVFGGMTAEARAAMRHELAPASINKQRQRLERMRVVARVPARGPVPGFPAIPM